MAKRNRILSVRVTYPLSLSLYLCCPSISLRVFGYSPALISLLFALRKKNKARKAGTKEGMIIICGIIECRNKRENDPIMDNCLNQKKRGGGRMTFATIPQTMSFLWTLDLVNDKQPRVLDNSEFEVGALVLEEESAYTDSNITMTAPIIYLSSMVAQQWATNLQIWKRNERPVLE